MLFLSEILVVGGFRKNSSNSMEFYCPDYFDHCRRVEQTVITGRSGHVSALMSDGRVLTAGGVDENWGQSSSTELFDPRTGRVQAGTDMHKRRYRAAAAAIDDAIYVCGGHSGKIHLSSCERFVANKWTEISSMKVKRYAFAMVAVDGKLFAIGGFNRRGRWLSVVERFDPKNGQWQFVSPMRKQRFFHSAAVLNGQIYVCGGSYDRILRDCERYDPGRDQWEVVAAMNKPRKAFSLVALNGRLYAVGAFGNDAERSVESYDLNRDEWTLLEEKLIQPRRWATAVVL